MKILLALPDRDLLSGLGDILTLDGNEVTCAFDAIQAARFSSDKRFDAALVDRSLPRGDLRALTELLHESKTPVVVVTKDRFSAELLMRAEAESYMTYPFLVPDLTETLLGVTEKASSGRVFDVCGIAVDVSKFLMGGSVKMTNEEIDVLEAVCEGRPVPPRRREIYVASINAKMARIDPARRIEYVAGEGYRVRVTE